MANSKIDFSEQHFILNLNEPNIIIDVLGGWSKARPNNTFGTYPHFALTRRNLVGWKLIVTRILNRI